MKNRKEILRHKRHKTIRLGMKGSPEKPRVIVRRSLKNLFVEIKDDIKDKTLFYLSTQDKEVKDKFPSAGNIKSAEFFGGVFAKRAQEKGIKKVVFDRAGYLYHGRVKAFADACRKGGLEF